MKNAFPFLAAAALAVVPAPSLAQSVSASANEDLRCAAWSAIMSGAMDEEGDAETANGFAMAMTYFIGRYEGATGRDIGKDLTVALVGDVAINLDNEGAPCIAKMENLGGRMESLGDTLMQAGGGA